MSARLPKREQQFVSDMTRCRGMDWVRLGMMVEVNGDLGTIMGMNSSANIDVVFVNQLKMGKHKHNCHPTWQTRYFDAKGNVIHDYTDQVANATAKTAAAQLVADIEHVNFAAHDAVNAVLHGTLSTFPGLPIPHKKMKE